MGWMMVTLPVLGNPKLKGGIYNRVCVVQMSALRLCAGRLKELGI